MAKKISSRDLFENEDIFKGIRESAAKTLKSLDDMRSKLKQSAEELKKTIGGIKFGNTREINKLLSSLEKINKLSKEAQAIDQMRKTTLSAKAKAEMELLAIEQQKQRVKQETLRTAKMEAQEEARLSKERDKATKSAQNQASFYKQLEANTRELKNRSKELGAQMLSLEANGQKNTAAYRALAAQYKQVTAAAQQGDAKLKQLDKTVGDNFRNVGNYTQAVNNFGTALAGAFGVTVGLQGFVNLFKELTTTFMGFEFQSAVVASVLDKTSEETKALQENAKYLGATTARTALETAQLQEAYARLGFSMEEILKMTKATIDGSIAMNSNLADTAELTGAVVRSFEGYTAAMAPEIQDKMVAATQKSALSFQKLQTSIPIVAGAANSAGISFDRMLALLGKLSDAGIDASSSATSLRNIFIESAGQGLSYNDILQKIANSSDKLTMGFDEFGKRAAVASNVLAGNLKGIDDLESAINNSAGAAERAANNQLNTLQGRVTLLGSAWEGFLLSLEDGKGTMGMTARYLVDGFAEVLNIFAGTSASVEQMTYESEKYYTAQVDNLENLKRSKDDNYKATMKELKANLDAAKTDNERLEIQRQIDTETKRYHATREQIIKQQDNLKKDTEIALQQRLAAKSFAETLITILGVVYKIARAWVAYKAVTMTLLVIEKARTVQWRMMGQAIMAQIPMTRAYRLEQIQLARAQQGVATGTNAAATATRTFGRVIGSIGWMVIISALIEVATQWYNVASGTAEARRQQDLYAQRKDEISRRDDERATKRSKDMQKELSELQRQRNEGKLDELEFRKKSEEVNKKYLDKAKTDAKTAKNLTEDYKNRLEYVNEMIATEGKWEDGEDKGWWADPQAMKWMQEQYKTFGFDSGTAWFGLLDNANQGMHDLKSQFTALIQAQEESAARTQEEVDVMNEGYLDAQSAVRSYAVEVTDNSNKIKSSWKDTGNAVEVELKQYQTELDKIEKYLTRQIDLLYKIKEIERKSNIEDLERQVDAEFDYQQKQLEEYGTFETKKLNELINKRADAEVDYLDKKGQYERDALDRQYDYEMKERALQLAQEKQELKADAEETLKDNLEAAKGNAAKTAEAKEMHKKALEKIDENYRIRYQDLDEEEAKRYADLQLEKEGVTKETNKEIADVNRKRVEDITKMEEELTDDYLSKQKEKEDKAEEDRLKKIADREKAKQDFAKITADYLIKQSERIVEQLDKEIEAARKQADMLREMAQEGNINAQESIAEQERLIAEATKRKEQELRRQQRIRLAETVYTTYSQKVENGSKNPLAETIRDTTLLQAFINSLPTYEKGTEDTGRDGKGVDGKGGMLSVLHPNERVIPKSLNQKIGTMSNEQLAKIAQEYNTRSVMRYKGQDSSLDFALLVSEMKDLKKEIINKPVTSVELGRITQSAIQIVEKTQKGNSIIYNRYRVGK
jgi:hypothetical protein